MKVRMRRDVLGDFHNQRIDGMYGARRGDIVDLPERDVLRYLKIDLVELKLDGEPGRGEHPNAGAIRELEKKLRADDAKRPTPPATRSVSYDGVTYVHPSD